MWFYVFKADEIIAIPQNKLQKYLNALQDSGIEEIKSGVNLVGNKTARFLHKSVYFTIIGVNYNTVT